LDVINAASTAASSITGFVRRRANSTCFSIHWRYSSRIYSIQFIYFRQHAWPIWRKTDRREI